MCDNVEKCCRICLDVEMEHILIVQDPSINLHIKSCLNMTISPNDNLPKSICISCVSHLRDFYNFQLSARCSLDWLEYSIQERTNNASDTKMPLQPMPDSAYNSDSLLEFLNNTENIEEYLNSLGKEDIPSLVNILDKNTDSLIDIDGNSMNKSIKYQDSKKSKPIVKTCEPEMEIDVLDSEVEIVKEILTKETKPKIKMKQNIDDKSSSQLICLACKITFDNVFKLSQHMSTCDYVSRTCVQCNVLFDSKLKMQEHCVTHKSACMNCYCGKQFQNKRLLFQHQKTCHPGNVVGCNFRCKECDKTFEDRLQLYKHAKIHVIKCEEKVCDICGHIFIGEEALIKHRRDEHNCKDSLSYRCKVCSFTSMDRKEIYLHIHEKHTIREALKRHLCESCGQSFATYSTLMRHSIKIHGHLRYKCNTCDERFAHKLARDEHVTKHDKTVICEKCGSSITSCKLDMHICVCCI